MNNVTKGPLWKIMQGPDINILSKKHCKWSDILRSSRESLTIGKFGSFQWYSGQRQKLSWIVRSRNKNSLLIWKLVNLHYLHHNVHYISICVVARKRSFIQGKFWWEQARAIGSKNKCFASFQSRKQIFIVKKKTTKYFQLSWSVSKGLSN